MIKFTLGSTMYALCVTIVVCASSTSAWSQETETDTPAFPAPAEFWSSHEFRQAIAYVTHIAKTAPKSLPREDDEEDRFDRLVKKLSGVLDTLETDAQDEQIDKSELMDFNQQFLEEFINPTFIAYSETKTALSLEYEREIMILLPLMARSMAFNVSLLDQLMSDLGLKDRNQWPAEAKVSYQQLVPVVSKTGNAFLNVLVRPGHIHTDLRKLNLVQCRDTYITLINIMNEGGRNLAIGKLEFIHSMSEDDAEKEAITQILSRVSPPQE